MLTDYVVDYLIRTLPFLKSDISVLLAPLPNIVLVNPSLNVPASLGAFYINHVLSNSPHGLLTFMNPMTN